MEKVSNAIKKANKIALFIHTRPDGDALGSAVALCVGLKQLNKQVEIFCDGVVGDRFSFLSGIESVKNTEVTDADLYISLDCGDLNRLGMYQFEFGNFNNTINIDHHMSNGKFAKINYVKDFSATAEIVLELLEFLNIKITSEIATALYVGVVTDTGNFSHTNTNAHSFETASKLCLYDIQISFINDKLFKSDSITRVRLLGKVLSRIRTYNEGKIGLVYILSEDLEKDNGNITITESFVDYAINLDTAEVGVSICQVTANTFKISMRSRGTVDVCDVCRTFGGGGHKLASGCMSSGYFEDVVDKILKAIRDCL